MLAYDDTWIQEEVFNTSIDVILYDDVPLYLLIFLFYYTSPPLLFPRLSSPALFPLSPWCN